MPVADRAERKVSTPLGQGDHTSRGSTAVSFASPAMAATSLSRSCPIRIISVHLLDPADVIGLDYPSETFRVLKNIAKIRATRVELLWTLTDLHDLLWQCLCNDTPSEAREFFRTWCQEASATRQHTAWELLKNDLLSSNQSPAP